MAFGAIGDTWFNVVLLAHLCTIIIGTGAAILLPLAVGRAVDPAAAAVLRRQASCIIAPGLFIGGALGGGLVAMSDGVYDFGQAWLVLASIGWVTSVIVAAIGLPPSYVHIAPASPAWRARLMAGLHVAIAVQLVVMVWKPGA